MDWNATPTLAAARALDAERADVRAWLHDRVLQMLEYLAAGGYDETLDVARLRAVAALAADEVRAFVEDGEPAPGADLRAALIDAVSRTQLLAGGLEVELATPGGEVDVAPELALALAEAAGEALANARKHAHATRARVTCSADHERVEVVVEDDGAGFDTRAAAAGNGVRRSIVARMLAAGGSARLDSRPGEGTRVVLRAPVRRPAFVAGVRS